MCILFSLVVCLFNDDGALTPDGNNRTQGRNTGMRVNINEDETGAE